jgi:hypothetical protein
MWPLAAYDLGSLYPLEVLRARRGAIAREQTHCGCPVGVHGGAWNDANGIEAGEIGRWDREKYSDTRATVPSAGIGRDVIGNE